MANIIKCSSCRKEKPSSYFIRYNTLYKTCNECAGLGNEPTITKNR